VMGAIAGLSSDANGGFIETPEIHSAPSGRDGLVGMGFSPSTNKNMNQCGL
jgi:hypothetical protein